MDIIFKGTHTGEELATEVNGIVRLFKDRYRVPAFREVHLVVTLLDEGGQEVELVDSSNSNVYRTFEVYRENSELKGNEHPKASPNLKLIVDNTKPKS